MLQHECKWIADKQCWRLVHPDTGDFIAEYYPKNTALIITKHRKTAVINLHEFGESGITVSKVQDA